MMIDFSQPAVTIGTRVFTVADVTLVAGGVALVLLAAITVLLVVQARTRRAQADEAAWRTAALERHLAELAGRLQTMAEGTASRDAHLARNLDQRLDQISQRMGQNLHDNTRRTTESLSQLHERLAVIDSAQKNITELSTQVVGLQGILANKQTRGAFGQGRMEAIVADGLPRNAYTFQHTLSNNNRPDCTVHLPNNEAVLVIDAKFPLEAYNLFREADEDGAKRSAAQQMRTDITQHINAITRKYRIPGETQDTAIMFVPSESVYAELYEHFEDLVQKAYRARVLIVSPNMLMLAIQTMQAIFKDAQMREQAGLIKVEVAHMMEDVHRLRDRVVDLQRHFGHAAQDIEKILVSSEKVSRRGLKIDQLEFEEPAEEAALDKAAAKQLAAGE
jgi:DNA recombination protein RmuC